MKKIFLNTAEGKWIDKMLSKRFGKGIKTKFVIVKHLGLKGNFIVPVKYLNNKFVFEKICQAYSIQDLFHIAPVWIQITKTCGSRYTVKIDEQLMPPSLREENRGSVFIVQDTPLAAMFAAIKWLRKNHLVD